MACKTVQSSGPASTVVLVLLFLYETVLEEKIGLKKINCFLILFN